ncbi:Na/Pi cotransporter family protein [Devosia lucknowensis]|uniref:Na/Pi cotransporter family protein n=1 Tax=Devosia lucknowensis TaxID=1096929 RepID=UPI000A3ADE46|nr:Na/Pi cotransporter family protein [Devosia lucknowensis]
MDASNPCMVLLHLAGAVTLLLWVAHGAHWDRRSGAMFLKSSTAVALLASGSAASGTISLGTGYAMMLGTDVGSAMVMRILLHLMQWLSPLVPVDGGLLFFRLPSRTGRQGSRTVFSIALVLLSLQMIGDATAPLRDTPLLPEIVG